MRDFLSLFSSKKETSSTYIRFLNRRTLSSKMRKDGIIIRVRILSEEEILDSSSRVHRKGSYLMTYQYNEMNRPQSAGHVFSRASKNDAVTRDEKNAVSSSCLGTRPTYTRHGSVFPRDLMPAISFPSERGRCACRSGHSCDTQMHVSFGTLLGEKSSRNSSEAPSITHLR